MGCLSVKSRENRGTQGLRFRIGGGGAEDETGIISKIGPERVFKHRLKLYFSCRCIKFPWFLQKPARGHGVAPSGIAGLLPRRNCVFEEDESAVRGHGGHSGDGRGIKPRGTERRTGAGPEPNAGGVSRTFAGG